MDPADLEVHFDKGVFPSLTQARAWVREWPQPSKCGFHFAADSRTTLGIQLADLVANAGARILLETLTGNQKIVDIGGHNTGYEPGTEAELGWALRMMLRYSFFVGPLPVHENKPDPSLIMRADLYSYGIYISSSCPEPIAKVARDVFDTMWMGCIH
jgi:hypothetical protein